MQDDIQTIILKFLNLDSFYLVFVIISMLSFYSSKNYLDLSYFLLITVNYIRLKIHRSKNS